jgi:ABC-2 type transport system ATP-binding protein
MDVIEVINLYKEYGDLPVLRGLNLRVGEGEVYGLLGPNGAGKSTLLHTLLGFLRPTSGEVRVLGEHDPERARGRVGYLPERSAYHTRYSAREYLRFLGRFSDMDRHEVRERVDLLLNQVGLAEAADRLLATFSKGMLQRLGIAQALLSEPELLLIDEPTGGLDPGGQRDMLDLLAGLRGGGRTILLATHYFAEIDLVCDRVGVLSGGRITAEAAVSQLRGPGGSVSVLVDLLPNALAEQLRRIPGVRCDDHELILSPNSAELQSLVLRKLLDAEVLILALEPQSRPLELFYVQAVRGEQPDLPDLPEQSDPSDLPGSDEPEYLDHSIYAPPGRSVAPAAPVAPPLPQRPAEPVAAPFADTAEGDTLLQELLRKDGTDDAS